MNGRNGNGFSLVEVAMATTVMASAALLLSAALSTSNAQKAAGRRQALGRSLAVRQLELVQQRINESQIAGSFVSLTSPNPSAVLKLAALRTGGHTVTFARKPGLPNFYTYEQQPLGTLPGPGGNGQEVPQTSDFHVLKLTRNPLTDTVPDPAGSMLQDERDRVDGEHLSARLFAVACTMNGDTDQAPGPVALPLQMQNLELILFQVAVVDTLDGPAGVPVFTLSRMYRVQSSGVFGAEGQF